MTYRHVTAPTQFVESNGIRFAYRRFGQESGTPLLFMAAQRAAITEWRQPHGERFAKLKAITQPTLVVNGHNDIMVPTIIVHALPEDSECSTDCLSGFRARFAISVSGTLCDSCGDLPGRAIRGHGPLEPPAVGSAWWDAVATEQL